MHFVLPISVSTVRSGDVQVQDQESPVLCVSVCVALHNLVNTVLHVVFVKSRTESPV